MGNAESWAGWAPDTSSHQCPKGTSPSQTTPQGPSPEPRLSLRMPLSLLDFPAFLHNSYSSRTERMVAFGPVTTSFSHHRHQLFLKGQEGKQGKPPLVRRKALNTANFFACHYRPEVQDLDGNPPCPGSASAKQEDVEEEEEEELEEEDDDSLAGKSQEDTVSPTPEPQGVYEDEEDEEPPNLTMGFDHTRRWAWPSARGWCPKVGVAGCEGMG